MKIESTEDYQKAMVRIDQLVAAGPERDSEDGIELQELADTVAAYESMRWPM
jgi:antitoxin component HigA of HigAB toxin-antitoxin module